jgi:hypothetical protein
MSQKPDPSSDQEFQEPSSWEPKYKPGPAAVFSRLLLLLIIAGMMILPFTPMAGRIKRSIKEIVESAKESKERVVNKETYITKEVPVVKEVVKEVIKEVPGPPPPLPEKYVPRKSVDIAALYNGITIKTDLLTEQGSYASLERLDPEAYKVQFQVSIRVPKANQSLGELARINQHLPALLPGLGEMLTTSKVSPFYHKLYDNKTNLVEKDLTRLTKILDRHNFFDCETILELAHPTSQRKALLIQSEMDVVCDGSDGDRMSKLEDYISLSDFYQPFTSYAWPKTTKTPNPLLGRWESRLSAAKTEFSKKGLPADRNNELKSAISTLQAEIKDMKARSSLIAEKDPFIVNSLLFKPYIGTNKFAPQIGDYAVVIHENKIYPAICGDYGPSMKMGEASLFMAKAINDKATPYRRPESDLRVTYLVFPGTADKPFGPPDLKKIRAKCDEFIQQMGGLGAGFAVHEWADPFPPPPAPPAPEPAPGMAEVIAKPGDAATPAPPNAPATSVKPAVPATK